MAHFASLARTGAFFLFSKSSEWVSGDHDQLLHLIILTANIYSLNLGQASCFAHNISFILSQQPIEGNTYYSHFIDEKTVAYRECSLPKDTSKQSQDMKLGCSSPGATYFNHCVEA